MLFGVDAVMNSIRRIVRQTQIYSFFNMIAFLRTENVFSKTLRQVFHSASSFLILLSGYYNQPVVTVTAAFARDWKNLADIKKMRCWLQETFVSASCLLLCLACMPTVH